jgi:hypothetical protein
MRGRFQDQGGMFSYIQPEKRIAANHPLRKIRQLVHEILKELNHTFGRLYAQEGRPSIPPERFHLLMVEKLGHELLEHIAFLKASSANC